jgi:hypothetical protein
MQTQAPVSNDPVGITFLCDWLGLEHRSLGDGGRERARRYIEAIVAHDELTRGLSAQAQLTCAGMLWRTFRETYDDLRGPYMRGEHEDVRRALARL